MTSAEIFDKETAEFGGRLPRGRIPEGTAKSYTQIEDRAQDLVSAVRREVENLPDIHVDFIHNPEINAFAFKSCGRYFIGLTTGVLFMLRSVIGRMLSDRSCFQHIGNPLAELDRIAPWRSYVPDAEVIYQTEPVLTPKDPLRRAYAEFLQDQALLFLLGHEVTHIVHGHVDYLAANRNQRFTIELGMFSGGDEEKIERQSIEIDADRQSIISRIDSLRTTFDQPAPPNVPWNPNAKRSIDILFDWALSINIVFRLFGDLRFTSIDPSKSAYPPLALRRSMCEAAAHGMAKQIWGPEIGGLALKSVLVARVEAEKAFGIMLGEKLDLGTRPEMPPQGYVNHGKILEDHLNSELAERLKPFIFGN